MQLYYLKNTKNLLSILCKEENHHMIMVIPSLNIFKILQKKKIYLVEDMSLKLTLCVPTKNRDKDIVFLLDSLLKQTYKKFKIIIDDASNNSLTKKVINNYKKKLDILYTTDYNGLTSQVNKGLRLTKSEYFMRTDDDAVFLKMLSMRLLNNLKIKRNWAVLVYKQ